MNNQTVLGDQSGQGVALLVGHGLRKVFGDGAG